MYICDIQKFKTNNRKEKIMQVVVLKTNRRLLGIYETMEIAEASLKLSYSAIPESLILKRKETSKLWFTDNTGNNFIIYTTDVIGRLTHL
jgi:predicted Zn-dependent protease with MMP-like domain